MSNIFDELGLDAAAYTEAEAQEVSSGFEVLPSGSYVAEVKLLATFTTEKGAGMMLADIEVTNGDDKRTITVYQNVKKKNGEANPIGTATFKHIIEATGSEMAALTTKKETIKAYGKDVEGTVVNGIAGKKLLALVRHVFAEGEDYENFNEIEGYVKTDGTNSKGENQLDAFKEKIEKNPILKRKPKAGAKQQSTTDAGTTAADVASML
jgi:hypothetical protein